MAEESPYVNMFLANQLLNCCCIHPVNRYKRKIQILANSLRIFKRVPKRMVVVLLHPSHYRLARKKHHHGNTGKFALQTCRPRSRNDRAFTAPRPSGHRDRRRRCVQHVPDTNAVVIPHIGPPPRLIPRRGNSDSGPAVSANQPFSLLPDQITLFPSPPV